MTIAISWHVDGFQTLIEKDLLHPNVSMAFKIDWANAQTNIPPKPRSPKVVNRRARKTLLINECTDVRIRSQRFPGRMPRNNK